MSREIRAALVGVGNCASALIQGIHYYRDGRNNGHVGLMHHDLGGYLPESIRFVAAFDIDKRKVTKDLSEAIFSPPNCTKVFHGEIPFLDCRVERGFLLDGVARHMLIYPEEKTFLVDEFLDDFCSREEETSAEERVTKHLIESGAEILINYLPVGSQRAVEFYMRCALRAGCAVVNCMPVFIASDDSWARRFEEAGIPIIGDDIKSQFGATILHRTIARLISERGGVVERTYQLNTGGNTDFLNMLNRDRLASKKVSKTESVQSQLPIPLPPDSIHIGPSDYVPWQRDNKVCFLRIEGRAFGDVPFDLECRLSVEDSPNSGGVVIDAVRCLKLAIDRGLSGPVPAPAAYFMKHPPRQMTDEEARAGVEAFISGEDPEGGGEGGKV